MQACGGFLFCLAMRKSSHGVPDEENTGTVLGYGEPTQDGNRRYRWWGVSLLGRHWVLELRGGVGMVPGAVFVVVFPLLGA